MTTGPSAFFTLEGANSFCQQASFAYSAQPVPTHLARILHVPNEDWIKGTQATPDFINPAFLCPLRSTLVAT